MSEKKITKVRLEHDDGTFAELTDPAEVARWAQISRDQAIMGFNHGFVIQPFKWVKGKIGVCSCGHVHTKRYCGHVSGEGEEQVTCICDEPPVMRVPVVGDIVERNGYIGAVLEVKIRIQGEP